MCNQCEALRSEFAEDIIRKRLSVRPAEARMLLEMLKDGIYRLRPGQEPIIRVNINRIRRAIGGGTINAVKHEGYTLTDTGLKRVNQALELAA